ncbi:hypothetical protein GE061_003521 [Apolygus lucorum]|uniref:Uncharacterized protein n=1 Tax=Apolygus lucorum TaxID=248454 RepID=A0A8S9X4U8_APOLU|nr:hypothetical protein GE061_003521 [Apolygus lucorum]
MSDYSDIHKRARILEGELDAKLISFNKMCSNQDRKPGFPAEVHGLTWPSEHAVDSAGAEIRDFLGQLNHLNGEMSTMTIGEDSVAVRPDKASATADSGRRDTAACPAPVSGCRGKLKKLRSQLRWEDVSVGLAVLPSPTFRQLQLPHQMIGKHHIPDT